MVSKLCFILESPEKLSKVVTLGSLPQAPRLGVFKVPQLNLMCSNIWDTLVWKNAQCIKSFVSIN